MKMTKDEYQTFVFELLEQEGLDDDTAYRISAEIIGPLHYQIERDRNSIMDRFSNDPDRDILDVR